jgi:hypothetical protein
VSDATRPAMPKIVVLGRGRYLVDDGTRRRLAYAAVGRETWVFLDGYVHVLASPGTGQPRRRREDASPEIRAPMPATVVAIHVSPGQRVRRDELLLVLEAMKMALPIRAPRPGRVARIACQPAKGLRPLISPRSPLAGCQYLPPHRAQDARRGPRGLPRFARLGPLCGAQRVQNSRNEPHSGPGQLVELDSVLLEMDEDGT